MNRALAASLALALALPGCVAGPNERPRAERPAPGGQVYAVRAGDTLLSIATRTGVTLPALARANRLAPPYLIRVGQRLVIPPREVRSPPPVAISRPVVQPLPRPAPRPAPLPPIPPIAPPLSGAVLGTAPRLTWPADGPLGQGFGAGPERAGIAITAHQGAAVRAAAAGTVTYAGDDTQGSGKLVRIDHGGGWVSVYRHLARTVVVYGERVGAGARVGFVGASPAGTPSGLGFELRRDNAPVDPVPLLPPRF